MKRRNIIGCVSSADIRKDMRIVEKSEGLKFKQIPKVLVVKQQSRVGHNVVVRERQGTRITPKSSTVYVTNKTIGSALARPIVRHELREVLYFQHGIDLKKNPHKEAQKHWREDTR